VSIKASLNWGLSEKFKESFLGVIPATRPLVEAAEIKDPNWLRGFIEAEGCFQVIVQNPLPANSYSYLREYRGMRVKRQAQV